MKLKTKFRDWDDTTRQVWGFKQMVCKFRDRNDTVKQVWGLNDRFTSLGTGMTQSNKFKDRWRTLLILISFLPAYTLAQNICGFEYLWVYECVRDADCCAVLRSPKGKRQPMILAIDWSGHVVARVVYGGAVVAVCLVKSEDQFHY